MDYSPRGHKELDTTEQLNFHFHFLLVGGAGSPTSELCLTLFDPLNCSLPGSSVHGISQARILQWVVTSFSRETSQPRD